MNRSLLAAASLALAGCPDNNTTGVLWLAPDQNETHVKLVDAKPGSF
jgi:hypothetical protein